MAVWLNVRPGKSQTKPQLNRKMWEGIWSVILFTLGAGLAICINKPFLGIPPIMVIFLSALWWVYGMVLAISGMRSRSTIGVLNGTVGFFEFLLLAFYLICPRMEG